MATFLDDVGREWVIDITAYEIELLYTRLGWTTAQVNDLFLHCTWEHAKVMPLLWVLVEEQAEKRQLSRRDFLRALRGPSAQRACDALLQGMTDFFQGQALHPQLVKSMEKYRELVSTSQLEASLEMCDVGAGS